MDCGLMAQMNWTDMGSMLVVVIAALGGTRGVEAVIVAWRGRPNGHSDGKPMTRSLCEQKMGAADKLLKERHDAILEALRDLKGDVKQGLREVHNRVDQLFKRDA